VAEGCGGLRPSYMPPQVMQVAPRGPADECNDLVMSAVSDDHLTCSGRHGYKGRKGGDEEGQ
jgi:hypothetical protein